MTGRWWAASLFALTLAGCAAPAPSAPVDDAPRAAPDARHVRVDNVEFLDRLTFGATPTSSDALRRIGRKAWLDHQLRPAANPALPPSVQTQIADMTISRTPMTDLVRSMEAQRKSADGVSDDEQKKTAQQAYQQEMTRLSREAASRMLLRSLYSPNQLQEQMTWFWFNHFNVHQYKSNVRVMVGDYEEQLRTHALGRFRDLLQASVFHPAMVRYLDNEQNAAA